MTPFFAFLKRNWEKAFGRWFEGPEPPNRLAQVVLSFAAHHRRATRAEWIDFAARFAGECYRSGYDRGLQWAERDLERRDPMVEPELLAEIEGHDWEWRAADDSAPSGLQEIVPEEIDQEEDAHRGILEDYNAAARRDPEAR